MPTGAAGATNAAAYASYLQMLQEINGYYTNNAGSVWEVINNSNLTAEQAAALVPVGNNYTYGQGANAGYSVVKAADGSIMSWNNTASMPVSGATPLETALDSNAGTASQQMFQLPANTTYTSDPQPAFNASKGVTGGQAVNVMSQVSAGVAAAGLGIKLGKAIDSTLYNLNPDFWDNHGMAALNPQTWDNITADMSDSGWEGTLKRAFNAIFGLNPTDGKSQMYLDADAAAYLAMYMQEKGVFSTGGQAQVDPNQDAGYGAETGTIYKQVFHFTQALRPSYPSYLCTEAIEMAANGTTKHLYQSASSRPDCTIVNIPEGSNRKYLLCFSESFSSYYAGTWDFRNGDFVGGGSFPTGGRTYTYNNKTVYYWVASLQYDPLVPASAPVKSNDSTAWLAVYGNYTEQGGVDGITDQEGATKPDFTGCETPEDYKQALQQQYPDMFQDAITQNVAQPDGTVVQKVYIPVGTPSTTGTQDPQPVTDPQTSGQSQPDPVVDPQNVPIPIIEALRRVIENLRTPETPDNPNPPDTGDGNTPPVVPPTGQASSLFAIYNPSQAQLNSFGAWLWSANFVDQILKLFNDPMQSIIGLHKIFAAPAISGSSTIHVGYLDSGVGSNTVGAQYTDVNCGSVKVSEQFGNAFDYTDTHVRLYLPFIGIVDLDTSDVMRGTVSVVYHVDVITGACLAEVKVTRDGSGGTLYQYAGDAAVRYPISSGSYMGIVSGVLSAVGGIASAFMTGGATLPMAAGAVAGGMSQAKTQVQHSGNFSGCAGAMGIKKPYLIIERPQTIIADSFSKYQGKGANKVVTVGAVSGYFKLTDVHVNSISKASESEIEQIRATLENGVIK